MISLKLSIQLSYARQIHPAPIKFSSFCYLSWMFFYVICFQFHITCHACEYVLTNGISVRTSILLLSLQITPGNKCSGLSAWWLQPQFSSEVCVGVYGLTYSLIASEVCVGVYGLTYSLIAPEVCVGVYGLTYSLIAPEVCVGVYGLTYSLITPESCTLYKIYNLPFVPVHFSCSWLQWNSSVDSNHGSEPENVQ